MVNKIEDKRVGPFWKDWGPKSWTRRDIRTYYLRQRTLWRIWFKYEKTKPLQLYGTVFIWFTSVWYMQFYTGIDSIFTLPTDDPNAILKDPHRLMRQHEKQEREAEMRKRAIADHDRLAAAMGYNNVEPGSKADLPTA